MRIRQKEIRSARKRAADALKTKISQSREAKKSAAPARGRSRRPAQAAQ